MQTLRKRTSPCKYKNDPSRFLGEGITFKAKLIGILEVNEARGDKMCQDALNDLKTAIRAAGEHKQRITISISIDGLRLRDEKTGDCLYHHQVHKISFIAQDMSDSRAFGYIFGSPDTGHRFFGIKTDKTASQVVISMRDLFQVVFELKKKEIEKAKHHSEQHHIKYGSTGYMDSIHFSKDESETDKGKDKYSQMTKSRSSKSGDSASSEIKGTTSEAIADLLDLEHELNSIQQGINQMDKITPSDPFGPLSRGDSYIDPFDDSFSSKVDKPSEDKYLLKRPVKTQSVEEGTDSDKHSSFFGPTSSTSKTHFFSQFSPSIGKSKMDDSKWFDQETESLFNDTVNVNNVEPTSSPIALNTSTPEPDQAGQSDGKKSPLKTDLFTELDPLGTGSIKPYVDKKHFFQDLKNPPKKVLKEMITDPGTDVSSFQFPAHFKDDKPGSSSSKCDSTIVQSPSALDSIQSFRDSTHSAKYMRIDPFEDGDPFEKTDPFEEESFPSSIGFPPLFKTSTDEIFAEKTSWKSEKPANETNDEKTRKSSPTNLPLFSSSPLRVSLPPEKADTPLSLSAIASKLISSPPNSPEDSKSVRRKCYQSLKQATMEGSEDSPVHEEPFLSCKINYFGSKPESERRSPFKDKFYSMQSPSKTDRVSSKKYSSVEILDATTPDPPPRAKTTLFSIKPPPLPPKKHSQPYFRPPARPPSLEENASHYDYLARKEGSCNGFRAQEEFKCVKLKKPLFTGKESPSSSNELKKQNSKSGFPALPPPPHRKASSDGNKINTGRKVEDKSKVAPGNAGSILNIKLNELDSIGLENLAMTLGIPSENIFSMTLQELTKMLAEKYLTSMDVEGSTNDSFEADFDSNFAKTETNTQSSLPPSAPSSYDKYAVFKELIESETKDLGITNNSDNTKQETKDLRTTEKTEKEEAEEEDKYAALRLLSLNAQKSESFVEVEDKGKYGCQEAENTPGVNSADVVGGVLDEGAKWQPLKTASESIDISADSMSPKGEWIKVSEQERSKDEQSQLFPLINQHSDEKKPNPGRDNWATFENSNFGGTISKKSAENYNENENSPFSSDGKEEVREIPFHWHENVFRKKNRKDVPWRDDDESWDDYSPKESFCSDESSHEERSPDTVRKDGYEKTSWNMCGGRQPKSERLWNDKCEQWSRREKWQEETEDEIEDTWRMQRERTGSCDSDGKNSFWHMNCYEGYSKRYECCNSRSEPWDEKERHLHCRRKRSESDNEYRKRCDSDASDKECVWMFQKNYQDGHGRTGKQKQYYGSGHSFRDCPEYYHESRTKSRKGVSQKRPSSASESKRNYEKMFSPGDYSFRGGDKTYPGKREPEKEEFFRYGCKESRHRGDMEFSHYYSSYDRKMAGHHSKSGRSRGSNSIQSEMYSSPSKREVIEGCFEPLKKNYKYGKTENVCHFPYDNETENYQKKITSNLSPQEFVKSPDRRISQWASTNGKSEGDVFFSGNNNENFANFKEEFKTSPKKGKDIAKPEMPSLVDSGKSQGKAKNHLSMISRQESSSTLRKSDSINIFSRDNDPFEGDDFFSSVS